MATRREQAQRRTERARENLMRRKAEWVQAGEGDEAAKQRLAEAEAEMQAAEQALLEAAIEESKGR